MVHPSTGQFPPGWVMMQSWQIAWGHRPELSVVVVDRDCEQREQDSKETRDGEDSTDRDWENVYWSSKDISILSLLLLDIWRQ